MLTSTIPLLVIFVIVRGATLHYNDDGRLRILQIFPGFTNSHLLFSYRLAETLSSMGHQVELLTQMELSMISGNIRRPPNIIERQVPITFKDTLKLEGLKIFQTMMFNEGRAYDLWWTGQEFRDMRVESCSQMLDIFTPSSPSASSPSPYSHYNEELLNGHFDLAIFHMHDLCPLGMASKLGIGRGAWVTHGTSIYDYVAVRMGLRTLPSYVPHPLSNANDRMDFAGRTMNLLWHLSTLQFINLPENLLHEEAAMYRREYMDGGGEDLWALSDAVDVLFLNGERFLDFPRPLPMGVTFMGSIGEGATFTSKAKQLPPELESVYGRSGAQGVVIFSLGTVSNTSNMPPGMAEKFVAAFSRFPQYEFIVKLELEAGRLTSGANHPSNVHYRKWIPQKELMGHPKTKLLIAHGGYNSFFEAAQAGLPIILMPLFADQFINAERAKRFGIVEALDKLALTTEGIERAIRRVFGDAKYSRKATKLSAMLADKPSADPHSSLRYGLKLAAHKRRHFALRAAKRLTFLQFHNDLHIIVGVLLLAILLISL